MRTCVPLLLVCVIGVGRAAHAQATNPSSARDSTEAMVVFRENIDAIHKRDRPRYLATYLQTDRLTRHGLRGVEMGWEGWSARTQVGGWPDTLIAREMTVRPIAPGVVYGWYRYIGVNGGIASTGISMRTFVRTPQGMRIALTASWPDTLPPPPEFRRK
ncbi:MAG: hypothetical protein JNJ98_14855 [Gemmatimonadetes bacterium]|nr:hypothetical protein [Gemmatimonadota bacterium]